MADTNPSRDEIVAALKAMDENTARAVFDEARGIDLKTRQHRAAQALRQFTGGKPRSE
ncbi:hypothetical protein [Mycobacterium sp. E735]|uniref:hypothetical protein n=1 Tax=Mycobacterium sp. E735 TaxID=1834148 RepID=UPI000ADCFC7D|nr:hypothetical protein [Mycobacterium sp. E735]